QLSIEQTVASRFLKVVMEFHALFGRGRDRQVSEKGLVGDSQPVPVLSHPEPAIDREVKLLVLGLFHEPSQFRLTLGIRTGDDQAQIAMEYTQVALAIERELIFDRRVNQARKTNYPRTCLANPGGLLQFVSIARLLRWNWRRVSFVKVESILGD